MPTFCVVPVDLDAARGWVVKTTHDDGITETSIVYESQEKAQAAAASWTRLSDDWRKV